MAIDSGDLTVSQTVNSSKQLLERATPFCILQQLADAKPLPSNSTKTMNMRRYKFAPNSGKFDANGVPLSAANFVLTEGVTPADLDLVVENYDLQLTQYGVVTTTTDIVDDTHIDDVLTEVFGELGEVAGPMVEHMHWEAVRTGATNVLLAGGVGSEATIVAPAGIGEIRAAVRGLRAAHAKFITKTVKSDVKWESASIEPAFIAVMNSDLEGTIRKQLGTNFTPVADYAAGSFVFQGEFGKAENVRFLSSTLIGKRANAGATVGAAPNLLSDNATNVNLYDILVFGAKAWVAAALKGAFAVAPTMVRAKVCESDPLGQRSKAGFKTMQGAKVVQPAHIRKIICGAFKDSLLA